MNLGAPARRVKEQIAQLAAVRLDIDGAFLGARIALEHQHLVLGANALLKGIHCSQTVVTPRGAVIVSLVKQLWLEFVSVVFLFRFLVIVAARILLLRKDGEDAAESRHQYNAKGHTHSLQRPRG